MAAKVPRQQFPEGGDRPTDQVRRLKVEREPKGEVCSKDWAGEQGEKENQTEVKHTRGAEMAAEECP